MAQGSESAGEMKYCTQCGNAIEDEIVRRGYCPFCGARDSGTKFCPECGATLHQFGSMVGAGGAPAAEAAVEEAPVAEVAETEAAEASASEEGAQACPDCGSQLYYVQQYNQWYCYTCKGYKQTA